jgi:hypothetical protein
MVVGGCQAAKGAMLNQRIDRTPDGNFVVKVSGVSHFFATIEEILEKFKTTWHLKVQHPTPKTL